MQHLYVYFNEVSRSAQGRLDEAKATFTTAKTEFEQSIAFQNFQVGQIHNIQGLIHPRCHLTSKTWPTLRNFIEDEHPGWKAKRREATEEDDLSGCPGRRGKKYNVDVTYQDPSDSSFKKTAKRRPKHIIEAEKAAKKQRKLERYERSRKYLKSPFPFTSMPEDTQYLVLECLGIPTIGAVACTSKELRDLTAIYKCFCITGRI